MNSQNALVARTAGTFLALLAFIFAIFVVTWCTAQNLQSGIGVNLPRTAHASAVPDADEEGALIVTVSENGDTYLGTDPITPSELQAQIKRAVAYEPRKAVYIKADTRAAYRAVESVLYALHTGGARTTVLLTAQPGASAPGIRVSPNGLNVLVDPLIRSAPSSMVVRIHRAITQAPTFQINEETVSWENLQVVLPREMASRTQRYVVLKADGQIQFCEVLRVVDLCHSIGASVVLSTAQI
jgi:biopolymer transport protein ExbD